MEGQDTVNLDDIMGFDVGDDLGFKSLEPLENTDNIFNNNGIGIGDDEPIESNDLLNIGEKELQNLQSDEIDYGIGKIHDSSINQETAMDTEENNIQENESTIINSSASDRDYKKTETAKDESHKPGDNLTEKSFGLSDDLAHRKAKNDIPGSIFEKLARFAKTKLQQYKESVTEKEEEEEEEGEKPLITINLENIIEKDPDDESEGGEGDDDLGIVIQNEISLKEIENDTSSNSNLIVKDISSMNESENIMDSIDINDDNDFDDHDGGPHSIESIEIVDIDPPELMNTNSNDNYNNKMSMSVSNENSLHSYSDDNFNNNIDLIYMPEQPQLQPKKDKKGPPYLDDPFKDRQLVILLEKLSQAEIKCKLTPPDTYICMLCNIEFDQLISIIQHQEESHEEKKDDEPEGEIKCEECEKKFTSLGSLTAHITLFHKNLYKICLVCGEKFVHSSHLKRHMNDHRTNSIRPFCKICEILFENFLQYKEHNKEKHQNEEKNQNELHCPKCPHTFSIKSLFNAHLSSCHSILVQTYKCRKCGKKYTEKSELILHERKICFKPVKVTKAYEKKLKAPLIEPPSYLTYRQQRNYNPYADLPILYPQQALPYISPTAAAVLASAGGKKKVGRPRKDNNMRSRTYSPVSSVPTVPIFPKVNYTQPQYTPSPNSNSNPKRGRPKKGQYGYRSNESPQDFMDISSLLQVEMQEDDNLLDISSPMKSSGKFGSVDNDLEIIYDQPNQSAMLQSQANMRRIQYNKNINNRSTNGSTTASEMYLRGKQGQGQGRGVGVNNKVTTQYIPSGQLNCNICGQFFPNKVVLGCHMVSHSSSKTIYIVLNDNEMNEYQNDINKIPANSNILLVKENSGNPNPTGINRQSTSRPSGTTTNTGSKLNDEEILGL